MQVCSDISQLNSIVSDWKSRGERCVFTNGVFDILHIGHVDYLEKARQLGDRLIVAVNSDASVRRLNKGPERPINPEFARARIIAALRCVDAVIVFDQDTPLDMIKAVMPDVLVKGGDYDPDETDSSSKKYIVGSAELLAAGGVVKIIDLVDGFSTTNIVSKLKKS